ncbi:MAG: hypothetical protein HOP15_07920, partial [Planctomycetes bacterium]|nr:hypothetical protein [Planctomycetota bacterium]
RPLPTRTPARPFCSALARASATDESESSKPTTFSGETPRSGPAARANAEQNGLAGVRFVAGDLALTLAPEQLALRSLPRPAVCVVDPPRAGLHARVLDSLRLLEPARIVYVSCNPRSAVQDIGALLAAGYRLAAVQPVDLFPHTPHLECVFQLVR